VGVPVVQELLLLADVRDLLVERRRLVGERGRLLHDLTHDGAQAQVADVAVVAPLRERERQGAVGLRDERVEVALVDEVHAAEVARVLVLELDGVDPRAQLGREPPRLVVGRLPAVRLELLDRRFHAGREREPKAHARQDVRLLVVARHDEHRCARRESISKCDAS